jgi:hypothetical protein
MAYDDHYIGPYSPEYYAQVADQYYMPDYEPAWVTLSREAIRRGAETAQIVASGYPQIPQMQPQPMPPVPLPAPGAPPAPSPGAGITLSPMTLMLLVGGFLLFTLGKSKGR